MCVEAVIAVKGEGTVDTLTVRNYSAQVTCKRFVSSGADEPEIHKGLTEKGLT